MYFIDESVLLLRILPLIDLSIFFKISSNTSTDLLVVNLIN